MPPKLPGWVIDDAESIRREVEPYRRMSDDERAAQLVLACRASAKLLASHDDPARALAWQDPLPEDSIRKLAALRARYRAAKADKGKP